MPSPVPPATDPAQPAAQRRRRPVGRRAIVIAGSLGLLVVAAVLVAVVLRGRSGPAATGELSAGQRSLALRVARQQAEISQTFQGSPAPSSASGWPPNIERVSAIATTAADARRYGGGLQPGRAGRSTVLVIRLLGRFSRDLTKGPAGASAPGGNALTYVVDAASGRITDFSLTTEDPAHDLPAATVLYQRN